MRNPIPRVAAIHDLAGFARTSLTAAIPILSSMGIQAPAHSHPVHADGGL